MVVTLCNAQNEERPVTKIGGSYNWANPEPAYTLCFERERPFSRSQAFSQGPRIDYNRVMPSSQGSYGMMNLVLGYQFKWYPFSPMRKKSMRGTFFGANPCYFVKVRDQFQYGPGIGFLMGYQIWIKNKVALSAELNISGMRNVNQSLQSGLPNAWNLYAFRFLKVGYRFGKEK